MQTLDILLPAVRHAAAIDKGLTDLANSNDRRAWTESGVTWGKVVAHATAIVELEHAMRTLLLTASHNTEAAREKP